MPGMTEARAVGILRRRKEYLERVVHGKHVANQAHRHEDQEIDALGIALDRLNPGGQCHTQPVGSFLPSPTQGDPHG